MRVHGTIVHAKQDGTKLCEICGKEFTYKRNDQIPKTCRSKGCTYAIRCKSSGDAWADKIMYKILAKKASE